MDPRPGHIPGAHNLPCRENLDPRGRLLPVDELRRRFLMLGASAQAEVVSYCGSGITACHNLLAIEHAGLGIGRLYPGSWSQYSHGRDALVVTGAAPDGAAAEPQESAAPHGGAAAPQEPQRRPSP